MFVTRAEESEFRQLPGRQSADPLAGIDVGSLSIRFAHLADGPRSLHYHPDCVEVIYVVEGSGTAWVDGATEQVNAGSLLVVPARARHAILPEHGTEMLTLCAFPVEDLSAHTVELDDEVKL